MEPKFNINRPKVDDAEIESRKNFDDLVNKFKKESLQKARKDLRLRRLKKLIYSTVIAGATVFCTVTYINYNSNKTNNDKTATLTNSEKNKFTDITEKKSEKFINPISKKANVPYKNYKVNAGNGGTITHDKSKITIPAGSFVKKGGEEVKGEVEIQYREMHDQADFLASGIPMTYDSAGTTFHFESAGMIDIQGSQNGEEVFIKPGKNVKVEMASSDQGTQFNLYELDTVKKNWIFKGKDKVTSAKEDHANTKLNGVKSDLSKEPAIVKIDQKVQAIEVKKDSVKVVTDKKIVSLAKVNEPSKPLENNSDKKPFVLDMDPKEHPELSMYQDVAFISGDENKNYTKEMNSITWSDVKLSDGPKKGENYTLDLYLGNRHEKLIVYPVLKGKSYEKAMKDYQKKFDQYQVAVKKRADDEDRLKKELEAKLKAYNDEQAALAVERKKEEIKFRQQQEKQFASQFNSMDQEQQITRTFSIAAFGVYNSDCPHVLPAGEKVKAVFMNGNNILHPNNVFLINHDMKGLYTIHPDGYDAFSYSTTGNYSLCCALNGVVYVCSNAQFKSAKTSDGKKIFELNPINPEITSVYDLRKGLGLAEG